MEATIQNCRVHYEVHRCASKEEHVVLFLHGWGCDSTMFSFIVSSLAADATVISLDFPGHGKSGEPETPWGVGDYAEMVRSLLNELNVSVVDIVSHSFGSRVAIVLASRHPSLVHKLIITGGAGIKKPVSARQSKKTKRYKQFNQVLNSLKNLPAMEATVEKWQAGLRSRYGSPDYVKLDEVMRKTFVKVISEDLLPMLGDIKAPTLLVWGSNDTETPLWMGEQMEQNIPDAGLVVFEGRSHYAFLEEWQRFALIMREFLLTGRS